MVKMNAEHHTKRKQASSSTEACYMQLEYAQGGEYYIKPSRLTNAAMPHAMPQELCGRAPQEMVRYVH